MNDKWAAGFEKDPWEKSEESVQARTMPGKSAPEYFHLADLNEFVCGQKTQASLTVLDFGAGASPYQKYFPNADYRRADIPGVGKIQYVIDQDSTIAETDSVFDLILSTQVAEHVLNPQGYLKECFRLLKPNGKLILTTHGIWEEHGVPYDFQRWTVDGMRRDLLKVGFGEIDMYKITLSFRAGVLLFTRSLFAAIPPSGKLRCFCFKAFRWTFSKIYPSIFAVVDRWWPEDRILKVAEASRGSPWHIAIAAVAQKPGEKG